MAADTTSESRANSLLKLVEKVWPPSVRPSITLVIQKPQSSPQQAAADAQDGCFGHELKKDVAPLRAHCLSDADLACSLGHRHQHDVHDADAADEQGYSRYDAKEDNEGVRRLFQGLDRALLADDGKVVLCGDAMAQAKHPTRFFDALVDVLDIPDLDVDEIDCNVSGRRALAAKAVVGRRDRYQHLSVEGAESTSALALQQANHPGIFAR